MQSNFPSFMQHQKLFEDNRSIIIEMWVSDSDVVHIFEKHKITPEYFSGKFAIAVFDYFLDVVKGESSIGDCPVMSSFLQYLREEDITSSELFTICTKFRQAMMMFTYIHQINTSDLANNIAYLFDRNFSGVLEAFSATIKEAERMANNANKLLLQYQEAIEHGSLVSMTDAHGIITYVNDSFCKVSGYSREELIGHSHSIVRHENMTDAYFKALWQKISAGKVFRDTMQNKKKNGKSYFVDTVIMPLREHDEKITGFLSIRQDVTDNLEALEHALVSEEEALKAKEEAILAEKSKDDFLSNMSHEIRTPLNAILGFVQLLEKSSLADKEKGYLNVISNSGNTLLSLINDILDFAKIRSGKFSLDPFDFDPFDEFESAAELFTSKMREKSIDYLVYIDPLLPKTLHADAIRIKQIILNFLGNAVKFTHEHGTIRMQILYKTDKNILSIYVKDSGVGIKKENQDKIFTAFSQEETHTSRKFGGTGLGLSISESLAMMMQADIGFESEEGKGSTFFVHIPVPSVTLPQKWPFSAEVALHLDDAQESNLKLLQKYFSRMNIGSQIVDDIHTNFIQKTVLISSAYFEKYLLNINYNELLEGKRVVLLDNGDTEFLENINDIEVLTLPLYPSKIAYYCTEMTLEIKESIKIEAKRYKGKVLVAEDNKTNQMLITILLSEYGIDYVMAEDGLEALKEFQNGSFDLVLMDNNMPNMSGIEATEKILAYEHEMKLPFTPIIALTANATTEDRERFLSSGMDGFLAKPLDVSELETVLNLYLEVQDGRLYAKEDKGMEVEQKQCVENSYFDYEALSEKIGLPIKMIERLVESFMDDSPKVLDKLREAVSNEDMANIELYAHSIKGSAANLSLETLVNEAKEMEIAAKEKSVSYDYSIALETLEQILDSIKG